MEGRRRPAAPDSAARRPGRRPVRVGFVIDELKPGAGTENQLLLLFERFDRSRLEPLLCCLRGEPEFPTSGSRCEARVLGLRSLASPAILAALGRFRSWVRSSRLDFVSTFFRDANLLGTVGGFLSGCPVVSNRRNLGRGYWHTPLELRKLRALNGMTSWFVANSGAIRDYTVAAEGVRADRVVVIPNGVDRERFRPAAPGEREALRRALGFPEGATIVGCVANLREVKGVDVLVRAFPAVRREIRDARLFLVGVGREEPKLRALAESLGISGATVFLGSRQDVPDLLRCFDVGALPSRAESSPNAVIEYLASGLPAVATAVGGTPDVLRDGAGGVLVPPDEPEAMGSALARLLADPRALEARGRAARLEAERRFGLPAVLEMWYRFFEERLPSG